MSSIPLPLFVDLDGTLIRNDLTVESVLQLLKKEPWMLLLLPYWFYRGRAYLKRKVADRVSIDAAILPYNQEFLTYLKSQSGKRPLILATASEERYAHAVNKHLGLFSKIIGSNGDQNLKGEQKLKVILLHTHGLPFGYAGNSSADLPIFQAATESILVNASRSLLGKVRKYVKDIQPMSEKMSELVSIIHAIRPHHWVKNLLVLLPIFTAHEFKSLTMFFSGILAMIAFNFMASTVYLINDLVDIDADRRHEWKRKRPIAFGVLSVPSALIGIGLLLLATVGVSSFLPTEFCYVLAMYFLSTIIYSFWLKKILIVDTVALAILYTFRVLGGTFATGVPYSAWLIAFSMFLFFSLALMKRFSELRALEIDDPAMLPGRKYIAADRHLLLTMGVSSSYLANLIMALYINSDQVISLYHRPWLLWLICPLLLTFVSRLWMIAYRGELRRDPVVFVLQDIPSIFLIILSFGIVILATSAA